MIVNENERSVVPSVPLATAAKERHGIQFHFSERRILLILVDSAIVMGAAWAIAWLSETPGTMQVQLPLLANKWLWVALVLLSWWALAMLNDLYDVPTSNNVAVTMRRLVVISVTCLVILVVIGLVDRRISSLWLFFQFLTIILPAVGIWRWVYAVTSYRPPFLHRVLILGGGHRGRAIVDLLNKGLGAKCMVMGFVDEDTVAQREMDGVTPLLGSERDLPQLAQNLGIHEIVVAKDRQLEGHLFDQLLDCQALGTRVSWMPDIYGRIYRQTPIEHIEPAWILQAMEGRPIFSRLQQSAKRLLDLVIVLLAMPALLLVLLPIAVLIRLDSPGPAFYRQIRAGRGNRPFSIFKFRTMVTDAEKDGRARWAEVDDPRITRVGRVLRKARLDELPQVLNVLRGEMTLVGPRPERPEFIDELQREIPYYRTRLMVKPGITGWAQVQYEYCSTTQDALEKLRYDFYYIQYWSLWMDLYILYRTVGVMLQLKGR